MRQPCFDRVAVVTVAWSVVAASLMTLGACTKPELVPEPVRSVRTQTVVVESAGGVAEYAAEVKARTESRLGFRVGGKILRRYVELGQVVKAGQLLAQLDPQDLRLGQDSARAALVSAQANFDLAASDFKRYKDLRDQGFIGVAELERRDTAMRAAQATLDQARAQASVQGNQTGYASLLADAPGVITGVEADPGTVVAAGTPVLRLAHAGPRDVVFAVPEDKLGLIKTLAAESGPGAGPAAGAGHFSVRLWGASGEPLPATIREISAAADAVTRTFLVKADIGSTLDNGVQLGQTATVLVDLPKTAGIIKLPLSALKEEQGKTGVWVIDTASMTVRAQPVSLAGADGNDAVISAGLNAGQVVVTAGVHVLSPGQKVRFYAEPGAPHSAGAAALASSATPVAIK